MNVSDHTEMKRIKSETKCSSRKKEKKNKSGKKPACESPSRVLMHDCVIIRWGARSEEQDFHAITVGYTSGKWNRVISGRPVHPTRGYWNSSYARMPRSILLGKQYRICNTSQALSQINILKKNNLQKNNLQRAPTGFITRRFSLPLLQWEIE